MSVDVKEIAPKVFVGVVAVQTRNITGQIVQNNETCVGVAASEDAARGQWIHQAISKYPGGSIVYQGVYDITAFVQEYAEAHLLATEPTA